MITCTPDIFSRYISVMDFKKIFSVVVCAVGIFFSTEVAFLAKIHPIFALSKI